MKNCQMIKGVGIDIEKTEIFEKEKNNKTFLNKIFSKKEIEYCERKKESYISYTGKFCAKEAVIKALDNKKIDINKIEILNDKNGKISVFIDGENNKKIKCSISHTDSVAIAFVIIEE